MISSRPRCSFCQRPQDKEVRLLEAHDVAICNYCVAFAYQVFEAEGEMPALDGGLDYDDPFVGTTSTRSIPHTSDD